jgi:hypothetical protein
VKRRLFNLAAAVSLGMMLAAVALWVRSYRCCDEVTYRGDALAWRLRSYDGALYLIESRFMMSLPGWSRIFNSKSYPAESGWTDQPDLTLRVPFLSLLVWTATFPYCRFLLSLKGYIDERSPGLCRACGYDLRATPDRCPECGTPAAASESRRQRAGGVA